VDQDLIQYKISHFSSFKITLHGQGEKLARARLGGGDTECVGTCAVYICMQHCNPEFCVLSLMFILRGSWQRMKSAVDKEWVLFGALALESHFLVGLPQFLDLHVVNLLPW